MEHKKTMRKKLIYLFFITIITSCNTDNNINLAKDYLSSKKFELAKKELKNIKENDPNYKNADLLLKQISYEQALYLYSENNFEKAKEELKNIKPSDINFKKSELLLENIYYKQATDLFFRNDYETSKYLLTKIKSNKSIIKKSNKLLEKVTKVIDSNNFNLAFHQYLNNNLPEAIVTLNEINSDKYKRKKNELYKKIARKKKQINREKKYIAQAVISSIFGVPTNKINIKKKSGEIYILKYYKKDAGRNYSYKIKFEDNKAIWGADDGRWRYEDNITYSVTKKSYIIVETFSDGSQRKDVFNRKK